MEGDESRDKPVSWRGCSMNEIYRNLDKWELSHIAPIQPSSDHSVLYQYPRRNLNVVPKPLRQREKWDSSHVRLPCSSQSQYPVSQSDGSVLVESRWNLIEKSLARPINNSRELEAIILSYNTKYSKLWKFRALHKLFEEVFTDEEQTEFFGVLLPKIIALALRLPELIMAPIPLLKQGQNRSVSLSQQQISCLLANAFLCTFPRRNTTKRKSEYSSFPDINFSRLFQSDGRQVLEKLKCLIHYFRRVCDNTPIGVLTFTRRALTEKETPKWEELNAPLGATPLHVSSVGTIEDQGQGLLQVDFANKYLGGGVLGSGCVQEEIRFVICPELLVSKLFTEALKPYEALIMVGCEQFSKYTGYASSFKWAGDFVDETPADECGRRQCNIVAIDALHFVQSSHQYREELILRELNKAYVGFIHTLDTPAPGVASGNWGCGAFGGEATLKALIQLMACTVTKRPLVYFTFGNIELRNSIHDIHTFFIENNVSVKQLWSYLKAFRNHKLAPNDLYAFICQLHRDKQQNVKTASSSQMQRVIASTKTLIIDFITPTKSTANKTDQGKDVKANTQEKPVINIEDNVDIDLCSSNSCQQVLNGENKSVKKEKSPECAEKVKSLVVAEEVEEVTAPEGGLQNGSRMRQRSLLEMLDCYYNKDSKRVRTS